MFQGIIQSDSSVLSDLKTEHLKTLTAPLDAYWEGALIGFADHYELFSDGNRVGYYCLNSENILVAFFLKEEFARLGEDALAFVIQKHDVTVAHAGTNDPFFLSLCLDAGTDSSVHTLLFQDNQKTLPDYSSKGEISFTEASEADFGDVFRHYAAASGVMDTENIETGFEGIKGYVQSVMDEHHIFALREGGELIATSECRISSTQKPFADVGMIVAAKHRRKGIGSYILARTKEYCYQQDCQPICSCEAGNVGSKKAIAKAGFVGKHRVLEVKFGSA